MENGQPFLSKKLRPYKFVVQAVVQELDGDDSVITEHPAEPVQLFGCEQLIEYATTFEENLKFAKQTAN